MARTRGASFSSRGESSRGESSSQGEARRRSTVSARRSRAAPIQDVPIAEERAVEEQPYEAYETHGEENAFTAPNDDDDEEEHVDVHDIQEDVGGFPGGPRDGSLLTHYVQHVAYAISQGRARTTLVQLLGVDGGTAGSEMEDARGPKVRLSWLREIYVQRCESQHWDYAARAYLLNLVGCTIFANKSASSIRVSYLLLFRDVHACGRYAWGVAALAYLYDQLGDASLASTKQMAGYLTLFQEHFPSMGRRRLVASYDDTTPRAMRWQSPRQSSTLTEIRS
ncbi:uncharacterized protein LOC128197795 [Vigna angularis]|uniref:uncharacterized protein LOC128197795 n=1 Tax=Phaseolus angularis TaxID=3914 RepID=UPI0022B2D2DB|nr:uncharacterized protein LOC128197795 [Vigna angularis]